ncbi:MAG TPA: hypothetical protein VMB20_10545 [Candidatus Acidoferrum sp.]|nr:hypothetical protein [Candidatus Acidoferrum sp.]
MRARPVELQVQLPLAFSAARESFTRVVRELGEANGSPERHTLAVYLRDLHVGVRGEIRVPIAVEIAEHATRFESAISIRAASDKGYFPTFEGTLSISPVATHSELWLQGTYQPPLGIVGALLDRTLLRNAAHRSLQAFLARIADDITGDEREREERHARDIRDMHH